MFHVYGGNNPHSAEYYHPLIITDEPHGGFDKLTDEAQSKIRVLAGVEYSRRGRPRPTAGKSGRYNLLEKQAQTSTLSIIECVSKLHCSA